MASPPPLVLPNELNLPPHLSAHKYFLVCTLTVAAWDTLVLSPRTWRLFRQPGWPALKILFHFLRIWMPAEFVVVAVAFFDTKWSLSQCQRFYLFEPIATAVLLAAASAVHVIRIHAIYDYSRPVLALMASLFGLQIVVTAISCAFYRSVPLLPGQGCIAGPRHIWVGIYWIAPTLLYLASFALALRRSLASLPARPISMWKLMLRDGLNLYAAIAAVHLVNVVFFFAARPTGTDDPIRTIVTSMAAVLTASMSLRIVLSVRGSLARGGTFALSASSGGQSSSRTTHVLSAGQQPAQGPRSTLQPTTHAISTHNGHGTYTLDELRGKPEGSWTADLDSDGPDAKPVIPLADPNDPGVKVTVDREIGYDQSERYRK